MNFKNNDLGILIIRISVGLLMLLHGINKLEGIDGVEGMFSDMGLPSILAYGVYVTEIIAPILILIGYRTRLAAAIFAFGALFIILVVDPSEIFTLNEHGGWGLELIGLYLFGSLSLLFTGAGSYAVSLKNKWD